VALQPDHVAGYKGEGEEGRVGREGEGEARGGDLVLRRGGREGREERGEDG